MDNEFNQEMNTFPKELMLLIRLMGMDKEADRLVHSPDAFREVVFLSLKRVNSEHVPLSDGRHPRRLARRVLAIIQDVANLSSSKDVNTHYKGYLFSIMTNHQRWRYFTSRLYPGSLDATLLALPKSLYFLYLPLQPFLWFWRRMKHQVNL